MKKILIIEQDTTVTLNLQRHLESESLSVVAASSPEKASGILHSMKFDIAIINSNALHCQQLDPVYWLSEKSVRTKVILIGKETNSNYVKPSNVITHVGFPLNCTSLVTLIKSSLNIHMSSGEIGDRGLENYLQLICMKKVSKAIRINHQGENGLLLLQGGRISYAMKGNVYGPKALNQILSWKRGTYREVTVKKFPPPNVDQPLHQLGTFGPLARSTESTKVQSIASSADPLVNASVVSDTTVNAIEEVSAPKRSLRLSVLWPLFMVGSVLSVSTAYPPFL